MAHLRRDPPPRNLAGKTALITGAGSAGDGIGNGRAIAIMLADEGCNVVCCDSDVDRARKTCHMISAKPGRGFAVPVCGDVTSARDCEIMVKQAMDIFGRLDILVNNVGVLGAKGNAVEVDMEEWSRGLAVNVSSMALMAKYAIPKMCLNKGGENRGVIVNMGSVVGIPGGPATPSLLYPTSKGAVVNMTRAMAAHHAKDGIRVNCICPGMVYTPMIYSDGMSEEVRAARRTKSLLGTEGSAWDCACAVAFLASEHARWITGVILPVDAGATAVTGVEHK